MRRSLVDPAATWAVNVLGTANLLQALPESFGAVVVVTSDKPRRDHVLHQPWTNLEGTRT